MSNPEDLTPPSVADMLRITGRNTTAFMEHIAEHVDKLESEVKRLEARIAELESKGSE